MLSCGQDGREEQERQEECHPACPAPPAHPASMRPLIIAIDGPYGAGKGTVARRIAAQLGYRHVDSGAMYRAVGWKAAHDGVPLDDEREIAAVAERSTFSIAT